MSFNTDLASEAVDTLKSKNKSFKQYSNIKLIETSRMVITILGEGGKNDSCLMGTEFQFCKIRVLEICSTAMWICLTLLKSGLKDN